MVEGDTKSGKPRIAWNELMDRIEARTSAVT